MKSILRSVSIMLSALLLAGSLSACAEKPSKEGTAPAEPAEKAENTEKALAEIRKLGEGPQDHSRVWYEIFVYSYCDTDGDGIGDLKGVLSKLDELEELGVGGIWLMPIHPSTSYHKYNVTDYRSIDPAYGTMEDFEALLDACESRGIRVILDLVLNHTGSEHMWFKEACAYLRTLPQGAEPDLEECPYVGYYNFTREEPRPANYHPVDGAPGWSYEGHFSPEMPDVDFGSQALRDELREIMAFWLQKGVDGFRLDAAKEFYSGKMEENVEVLRWIQETAEELKPGCYLVAEVWEGFDTIAKYYDSGICSIFNYAFGGSGGKICKVLQGAGNAAVVKTYAEALQKADAAYRGRNPAYVDSPFLSNHDVGRIAGFVGRDPAKTKLAGAMNILMSGSAYIYYGEELGMVCGAVDDPSYRAPMRWNEAGDEGTTQPPPGCTLPEDYPMGSLETQRNDDASVYNYYRQAIALRNALPELSHGIPTVEEGLNVGCVSAVRKTWEDRSCILLMNIDDKAAEVDLSAYGDMALAAQLSADGGPVTREGDSLHLPPYGVAVLLPAR